ncbi:GatB/YqeY domain-containing protein [Patescibacteria group bacterium]|nr:GatB/YqeY domain-containing protein [Patescibacteria group bacterium]
MALLEDLKKDSENALRAGDSLRTETLRMILASVHNEQIAKGKDEEFKEEEVVNVIRKEAKKRREAAEIYENAGRGELAEKENNELEIIKSYLPPEMNEEEIVLIIKEVVVNGETNFGKVMGQVMNKVAGRAEPGKVSELVKGVLEEGKAKVVDGDSPDTSVSRDN